MTAQVRIVVLALTIIGIQSVAADSMAAIEIASNATPVLFADDGSDITFGEMAATPHPSEVTVTGSGLVTDVNVLLLRLDEADLNDLEIALTSPTGRTISLIQDAGGSNAFFGNLTFDDEASAPIPVDSFSGTGTYQTSVYDTKSLLSTNPDPTGANLSHFDGDPANGIWQLHVWRDSGAIGRFLGLQRGWELHVEYESVVPEPASVCVWAGVLGMLLTARKRKRRR